MLPNFLNPLNALLAAALAVPLLLLLYFLKLRRQPAYVGSTLLWKKAIQDLQVNSPFQKLRRNLLLLLQLLLLLLLILAFARPVSADRATAGEVSVILLDRSASMSATDGDAAGRSRLAVAKERAKQLVDTMGRGDQAMVVAFDDSARVLQQFTTDGGALREAIDAVTPSDRLTFLEQPYKLADAQMAYDPDALRTSASVDVFLFSDGNAGDAEAIALEGSLTYEPIGEELSPNVGVVALDARRNFDRPTQVQVFARLANFGPDIARPDVRLSVALLDPDSPGEDVWTTRELSDDVVLLPTRMTDAERQEAAAEGVRNKDSVEFALDLTTAATIRVEVLGVEGDVLAADDVAYVFVPPPRPLEVLVVTPGNYYLEKAVNALNVEDPATMTPAEYDAELPTDYDVVFFDRHSPPQLPEAGHFVYFGGLPPAGAGLAAVTNADGQPLFFDAQGVLDWGRDHPMLAGLNLAKLYVLEMPQIAVPLEAQTLVEGTKGPLMVLHREASRTHLTLFDLLPSNFPLQVTFPVFLHNATQFLAIGSDLDVRPSLPPGTSVAIPRSNLARAAPDLAELRVAGPDGVREKAVGEGGDFALDPLEHVGLYATLPPVPQFERLAVNLLNPGESDVRPSAVPPGGEGAEVETAGTLARAEWWWWLVAAAGGLLLVEWLYYTRRVAI